MRIGLAAPLAVMPPQAIDRGPEQGVDDIGHCIGPVGGAVRIDGHHDVDELVEEFDDDQPEEGLAIAVGPREDPGEEKEQRDPEVDVEDVAVQAHDCLDEVLEVGVVVNQGVRA